jgi:hypothetical protein
LPNQSASDAPSGRVRTYAIQKLAVAFRRSIRCPSAGIAINAANSTADPQ